MSRVTSKLQVTIPKALADRCGIQPGVEVQWTAAGDSLRISRERPAPDRLSVARRLRLFDEATRRQRDRQARRPRPRKTGNRGWTREDLYERGQSR